MSEYESSTNVLLYILLSTLYLWSKGRYFGDIQFYAYICQWAILNIQVDSTTNGKLFYIAIFCHNSLDCFLYKYVHALKNKNIC